MTKLIKWLFKLGIAEGNNIVKAELLPVGQGAMMQPNNMPQISTAISMKDFQEVPVEKIIQASEVAGGQMNSFHKLLMMGQAYMMVGVEPVFLVSKNQDVLKVCAREVYENPLRLN